jgi:Tfp pilus assembly protein PilN
MRLAVNLATRPFRNERLPALVLWAALVVLVGLTVKHGFVVADLLSTRATSLDREVRALDAEEERLRNERAMIKAPSPDPATIRQWTLVRTLVDRRAFSWTDLLRRLEEVLPPGVHLTAIAPAVQKGQVVLDFKAVARTREEALHFVKALETRKDFADVFPTGLDDMRDGEGHEVGISLRYVPEGPVPAPLAGGR